MRHVVSEFYRGVEKREDELHGKITSSESGVKLKLDAEVEFGKVDDLSLVLGASRTRWQPNSREEKAVSENSVDKLPPNDKNSRSISSRDQEGDNINIRVEFEVCKREGVLFRDHGIHSLENITLDYAEIIKSPRIRIFRN
ncbi:hypothetical protein Ancab_016560 [Ancistrocladus abbreviatus]